MRHTIHENRFTDGIRTSAILYSTQMLLLSKKVDQALMSLAYLVEHRGRISSARAIAQTHDLPLPQLMNVLKAMHVAGILCSERGSRGGYQICVNLDNLSLYDLISAVREPDDDGQDQSAVVRRLSDQPPLRALQYKLIRFLKQVRLSDLVVPGRRIEVPVEQVVARAGNSKMKNEPTNLRIVVSA
jgi:Rrf2 family protein